MLYWWSTTEANNMKHRPNNSSAHVNVDSFLAQARKLAADRRRETARQPSTRGPSQNLRWDRRPGEDSIWRVVADYLDEVA